MTGRHARERRPRRAPAVVVIIALVAALLPAAPAWAAPSVDRLSGPDRFATAVAVSQAAFPDGASIAFLATGMDFADALSAAPAAAVAGGPLLLTTPGSLSPATAAEIRRLGVERVIVVGGPSVVSTAVMRELRALGVALERLAGRDRFETSRAVVERFFPKADAVWLATGRDFPDALAASAAAGAELAPVLLVDGLLPKVDAATAATVAGLGVSSVRIAGGPSVVSSGIEKGMRASVPDTVRLAGSDRYATAVAINQFAFPAAERAFIATGIDFPDALAGATLAGRIGAPLYSSLPTCLPTDTHTDIVDRLAPARVTLLGGPSVLGGAAAKLQPCVSSADARAASERELAAKLADRIATLRGTYSVSVRQLTGLGASVDVRGSTMQEPASVMKVFAAYAVLRQVDQGKLSLDTATRSGVSVRDCIRVTIHISENYCHWDLVALIGEQKLNDFFAAEGFRRTVYAGTDASGRTWTSKHTTTADTALLFSRLERGTLLSASSTAFLTELLETQLWRSRIPSGAPGGVPVGNKVGQLWTSTGMIEADAGIVSGPAHTYSIAIFGSRNATAAGVAAIARVVYEHFHGRFAAAATFPQQSLVTTSTVTAYSRAGSGDTRTLSAGTRVKPDSAARVWYRVIVGTSTVVYIHHSKLANVVAYPRS